MTLPGTVTLVLLLDDATLGGSKRRAFRVTVQSEVPGEFTIAGEQVKVLG